MFGICVINYCEKNFEPCAAIKFCCKVGFTAAKTWEMLVKSFGDASESHATVFRWHSRLVASEESIGDVEQSERPGTTKTNENITRVAAVLKDDHIASCRMIEESTGYRKPSFTAFYLMI